MNEALEKLGYERGHSGMTCSFVRKDWPTLHLHPSNRWTCDGHVADAPLDALLARLSEEYEHWADCACSKYASEIAVKHARRIGEMVQEVKRVRDADK